MALASSSGILGISSNPFGPAPMVNTTNTPVQLSALQRAVQSGGLTPTGGTALASPIKNTTNVPVNLSSIQQATGTGGLTTPQGSGSGGGFMPGVGNALGSISNALFGNSGNQGAASITAPALGTPGNPAGSQGASPLQPNQVSTTHQGAPVTETTTGITTHGGQTLTPLTTQQNQQDWNTVVSQQQAQQQAAREAANAAAQAVSQATTSDDKAYYQKQFDDAKAQSEKIDAEVARLSQMTPEEQQAFNQNDQIGNDIAQVGADVTGKVADVNTLPIAQNYLTGWGNEFNKEGNAKIQALSAARLPIQQQLSRLQAQRQSSLDVAKGKLNRNQNLSDTAARNLESYSSEQRKRQQALADEASKTGNFTLSPGQQQYVNGKLVASAPEKKTAQTTYPTTQYGSTNIPSKIKSDLTADIGKQGITLNQLYSAYPEVSTTYIDQIYRSLHPASSVGTYTGQ